MSRALASHFAGAPAGGERWLGVATSGIEKEFCPNPNGKDKNPNEREYDPYIHDFTSHAVRR